MPRALAHRLTAPHVGGGDLDVGAHPLQHLDETQARRVQRQRLDRDVGAGGDERGDHAHQPPAAGWLYLALAAVMLFPLKLAGLYYFITVGIFAPLLVWLGAHAVCENRMVLMLSERIGWLSYPLYCLH